MAHTRTIPRCMSSQHPDNVSPPFFAENSELAGEDEIQEAYYAFSHLGCDEQMWDYEGKEVDNFVVKKLLTKYEKFFRKKKLGEDVFLTFRVPNPEVEKAEAKILLETLESIPRSFDTSKIFYGDEHPPIFEVILPMTTSAESLDRMYRYYADMVVGKASLSLRPNDITIADWIGDFKPSTINVIPLFEDRMHLLSAHIITKEYLKDKHILYQRVFLARSDPAMNYGLVSAVLLNKIALKNLATLAREIGVALYPIIGIGSAPFRGNLNPRTVERVIDEYPSAHTFTIQSSFKYDYAPADVRTAVQMLCSRTPAQPHDIDIERSIELIGRYTDAYSRQMTALAPIIARIAKYVPRRRKRKLHVGLFGYARASGDVALPRAISFTCALYSIGVPPEILGLSALTEDDIKFLEEHYVHFDDDLTDALRYVNDDSPFFPQALAHSLERFSVKELRDPVHRELTDHILKALKNDKTDALEEYILRAASVRNFLG